MLELDYDTETVYRFLNTCSPGLMRVEGARGFAMRRDGEIVAAAIFENFNGYCVWAHVSGRQCGWLNRSFLRAFLRYVFEVCAVTALRGHVHASNWRMRRLARRLGAIEEAHLRMAAGDGGDVVICTLFKKDCKYESLASQ